MWYIPKSQLPIHNQDLVYIFLHVHTCLPFPAWARYHHEDKGLIHARPDFSHHVYWTKNHTPLSITKFCSPKYVITYLYCTGKEFLHSWSYFLILYCHTTLIFMMLSSSTISLFHSFTPIIKKCLFRFFVIGSIFCTVPTLHLEELLCS